MLQPIYFTSLRHEAGQQKCEDSQTGVSLSELSAAVEDFTTYKGTDKAYCFKKVQEEDVVKRVPPGRIPSAV